MAEPLVLILPSPGDLLDPGIEPRFPTLQVDSLPSEPPGKPLNLPGPTRISNSFAKKLHKGDI